MYFKKCMLIFAILIVIIGCSKAEKKKETTTVKEPVKVSQEVTPAKLQKPKMLHSSVFTDQTNWKNGFSLKKKNLFYFTILKDEPTPVKAGYYLKFAMSGEAKVIEVTRGENGPNSSIFVKVDKDLNPEKDGNPNPIIILGFETRANCFTDNKEWKNGIHLTKTGYFYFLLDKKEPTPVQVGNKVRFAQSGEAVVRDVFRTENPKMASIFVGVDKALDPAGAG